MSIYDNRKPNRLFLALFIIFIGALLTQCSGWSRKPDPVSMNASESDVVGTAVAPTGAGSTNHTVTPTEFAAWFHGDSVSTGGLVKPANSLAPLTEPWDFYKWSWQMFLWQMSPTDSSLVFNSPPFYDLEGGQLVVNGSGTSVRGGKVESIGQAGLVSGVLMSQKAGITPDGSLIYYAIHVNDVYAYMASGVNSKKLTNLNTFPTTQKQLKSIVDYAKNTYGVTIEDGESLAMELKSSWVKASDVKGLDSYITITADVPKYKHVSDKKWTWDGKTLEKGVTLALVGYHVVGSTVNHPEMIWATFEHKRNAPDFDYYYLDANGKIVKAKTFGPGGGPPIEKNWLLTDGKTKKNASNQMHMQLKDKSIDAEGAFTISASSTARTHPWGNNPDRASAQNNTFIISINKSIHGMLSAKGDVRANYFLVGATWTANGVPGVGNQLPVVKGSKVLANATMETYFQYKNCFTCHQGGNLNGLSHIFGSITPLPAP